ncbi:MAG: cytochrome P450 [Bacteroidia bacterium]|nr:cytochrome P450 [Bacteroidia bacterium]NNF30544.1 cytochrome P450 [Flavobacteriaceae bacterium]MBT8277122.1 cytochrome P450 [Bacteroidia bacterium]NNJ81058.1 cytochrome P450 [Flavobacteriaceae bacterium]NNK53891.1 cytochrome P450 [Flavobacteriaceae bacterium]
MPKKQKTYNYPERLPLLKFFLNAEAIRKNPIPFHRQFFNSYGDTFSVKLGRKKHIMLSRDKEVVQYILQKNHKNYYKSTIQTKYLSKYLGMGLLTANGEFWLKQRRLIQPAFHKKKMDSLVDIMQQTIEDELENLPSDATTDVFNVMNQLAFNVVANSLFNLSVTGNELKRLQKIIQEIQLFLVKEVRLPHKGWWFKLSGQVRKHKLLAEESRSIIRKIIEDRKASNETHDDLLDMLLATRYEDTGEPMSTKQLIDEISILFVAGHETTANALAFTSFLLAKHQDIQRKVFEEVSAARDAMSGSLEQIKMLPFTKAVIDESMRLYPPAWITDRENLEDDTIKEYHIRENTLVGVSFYELHRNPKYWESPDEFIPERFMGDRRKETTGIYFPFGAGPRMCIGMGFAIYEMVLAVSHMVYHNELSTKVTEAKVNPLITLKPIDLFVHFKTRGH